MFVLDDNAERVKTGDTAIIPVETFTLLGCSQGSPSLRFRAAIRLLRRILREQRGNRVSD